MQISGAAEQEFAQVVALLRAAGLPADGLDAHRETIFVARDASGSVVGCVALEVYADGGFLRSLAVAAPHRGRGLGVRLTQTVVDLARAKRLPAVYLLTETADAFFPRFGFRPIAREAVPAGVRTSAEFRGACPASARAMVLGLDTKKEPR